MSNTVDDPGCIGLCLSAGDIGLGGTQVAYPHPMCPAHGKPHPFALDRADSIGRLVCQCGAYQTEHTDQLTTSLLGLEAQRELTHGYIDRATELLSTAAALRALETVCGDQHHQ